jgi:hypothetical protein
MSLNNAMNAVIAMLENKPEVAREIFRAPESDIENISDVQAKLYEAVRVLFVKQIKAILKETPKIQSPYNDMALNEAFFAGVDKVETELEHKIESFQGAEYKGGPDEEVFSL